MTTTQKLAHCRGCRDNYYNMRPEPDGKCWMLADMTLGSYKLVPLDAVPPWKMPARRLPACYRRSGYVKVDADRTC